MQIFEDGKIFASGEAEWVAKSNGDWDLELANAVGQTILTVGRRGDRITLAGSLAARVPSLSVQKNGFLAVDGHLVGVKAAEVPCLLGFGLPRGWLLYTLAAEVGSKQASVAFADGVRTIDLKAHGLGARGGESACATLSWRKFLFLRQDVTYCETGRRQAALTGVGPYSLKWAKIDEQ